MHKHNGASAINGAAANARTKIQARPKSFSRSRAANALRRGAGHTLRLLLALALLSGSAPAAPLVLAATATELGEGTTVWLQTSPLATGIKRLLSGVGGGATPRAQEDQSSRDARVNRIQISPGRVNLLVGERVFFVATAYDQEDSPVGGVRFTWSARHVGRDRQMDMSQDGAFAPRRAGTYHITAEGAGRQARVTAVVRADAEHPEGGGRPGGKKNQPATQPRNVTTRALPGATSSIQKSRPDRKRASRGGDADSIFVNASFSTPRKAKASPAPAPVFLPESNWDDGNYWAADDPGNTIGDPPGGSADGGAGSGNFQISAPVVGLESRGQDLSINLVYNSRVWNKAGSEISFDIDRDWPAPGWSLGYGKMMRMGNQGSMLIDADGTRHGYKGTKQYGWFSGHTTDGTFIDYSSVDDGYGGLLGGEARMPNGTVIQYGARNQNVAYPTRITDANGNFITITYRNWVGPQIDVISDTMGRIIQFHYDSNNFLTAVTAPGLTTGTRTLVRLHYRQIALNYNFTGTVRVRDGAPWVLDAIYYPATNTGYWFGESDSYSTYGMIAKVSERRGMGFSGALNEHGTITSAGTESRLESYNYPLTPGALLSDAPTYTKMTVTWDGMDTAAAETNYFLDPNASPRRVEVTQPDGTKSVQLSHNLSYLADTNPEKAKDGLVFQDETRDSNNNLLQSSTVEWAAGDYDTPRPVRAESINHEIGKKTATTFDYGPRNQVITARNYDYADIGATPSVLIKTTSTAYENGFSYVTMRHIFNLPKKVEVFAADGTRVSLTENQYDGSALQLTPGVVQHDPAFDPSSEDQCGWEPDQNDPDYINGPTCQFYDPSSCDGYIPDVWVCHPVYDSGTNYRGNLTQVTTYSNPAPPTATGAVTETRSYDITGNIVAASTSCCEQTTYGFTAETQYAYPLTKARGSSDPNSTVRITSGATYDFNTGLGLSVTDADGHASQTNYDPTSLRPQQKFLPSGGVITYSYDDPLMKVTETTTLSLGGAVAAKSVTYSNGAGLVRREEALGAPEAGTWEQSVLDVVEAKYDKLGRVWMQSRPYRYGTETPQWTTNYYDALGRVWKAEAPDGSVNRTFFNNLDPAHPRPGVASTAPGETVLVADAWGRERWGRFDAQGRLVEVVEPDPAGSGSVTSGGLLTTYGYDTLGRLTDVWKEAQHRQFAYDGLGRLVRQKLAETSAVFDANGQYVGWGAPTAVWSEMFSYDSRSNLTSRTDARNVRTTFVYDDGQGHDDPLNRLQKVTYTVQTGSIAAADTASYSYATSGDLTKVASVTTKDPGTQATRTTEQYRYDTQGRTDQITLSLASRPGFDMVTNYVHDNLDRVTDVYYPRQYPTTTRKTVHHDYDVASRLSNLTVGGAVYASQFDYNASSQAKTIKVGAAGANQVTEKYVYDEATGLLAEQKVYRGADENNNRLLHLAYDFLRQGTTAGRTGQLTKITDQLNADRGRAYTYDALGRLSHAAGGDPAQAAMWTQDYSYDHYGNRTGTVASGNVARLKAPADPSVKTPDVELAANSLPKVPDALREKGGRDVTDAPQSAMLSSAAAKSLARSPLTQAPPSNVSVTAAAASQVSLSWTPPAGGAHHYDVERGQSLAGTYTFVGTAAAGATTFADSSVSSGAAYLYRVRAVDAGGSRSVPSNVALGAAFTFTDETLVAGSTTVKVQHLTELRQAVNAVRGVAGLAAATWTDASPSAGVTVIRAVHIQELRDRLNEALAALQIGTSPFTDPALATGADGTLVKKTHLDELRLRARRGQSASTGGSQPTPVPRDGFASLTYDPATNRISTGGWEYDAAGNQTRVLAADNLWRRYEYDAANRLVAVKTDGGGAIASYTYTYSNVRLMAQNGSARTYYAWGGGVVVAEYTEVDNTPSASSPQWSKNYIYMGGRLLATQQPTTGAEWVEYHHIDRLGTRVVTNASDQTYYEQTTLPYGVALSADVPGATRRFTSYDRSQTTGLDYALNRSYDPLQGRFTQVDPAGMKAASLENPQSLNLYSYVGNDPVNHTDADGLFWNAIKKFFKAVFRVLVLVAVAIVVAVAVIALVQLGGWALLELFVGLLIRNFVLGVFNAITTEIREHGFTFGSFFRGFGKGVARFFKGGAISYGNYCGPFNPNQREGHRPIDLLDASCQAHDRAYRSQDNATRLRGDRRLFLRALFNFFFTSFFDPVGAFYSLIVVIIFGVSIIYRTLRGTGSSQAAAGPTEVTADTGSRPRFNSPRRENHSLPAQSFPEVVSPAPQANRFRLQFAPG